LATANPDGTNCVILNTATVSSDPAWSPTADSVAFAGALNGVSRIYVVNAEGGHSRPVTTGPGQASDPSWSPDGKRVVFADDQTGTPQIYVTNAAGGGDSVQLTSGNSANTQPAWSPDGKHIAFVSDRDGADHVYVMNSDGTDQRRLTNDDASDVDPAWSPNGSRIAFAGDRTGSGVFAIYAARTDGTRESQLTHDTTSDRDPSWSPDGLLIAYAGARGGRDAVVVTFAPGAPQRTVRLPAFSGEQPSWGRLPLPSRPVPGVSINVTPHGNVQVQPGGSTFAVSLNGAGRVPVSADAPTVLKPAPGASVRLSTRLSGGRSAVITISKGTVSVSQPAGRSTRIVLMGQATSACPTKSSAHPAYIPHSYVWHVHSRGSGHPKLVHGVITLGLHGTDLTVADKCRGPNGLQVKVRSGSVSILQAVHKPGSGGGGSGGGIRQKTLMLLQGGGKFRLKGKYSAATVRG
jgi:hypothetical protein